MSLNIGELVGTHHGSVDDILQEMLVQERRGIELYRRLSPWPKVATFRSKSWLVR